MSSSTAGHRVSAVTELIPQSHYVHIVQGLHTELQG